LFSDFTVASSSRVRCPFKNFFIEDKATTWSLNIRQQTANDGTEKRYLMSELLKTGCLNNEINKYKTARIA
jgi:hypothetical protein